MIKERDVLFSGKDLALVRCGVVANANLCVTFSAYDPIKRDANYTTGFAESFLAGRDIPALHFVAKSNHWWHTLEMPTCLEIAAPLAARAKRRVGYGSSMGAFGCLRFGDCLGLNAIAAFAPQYSVNPKKVPWEGRWKDARSQIQDFSGELCAKTCKEIFVFFDPVSIDAVHTKLIAAEMSIKHLAVPDCGHFVLKHLNGHGVLGDMIQGIISGEIDDDALQLAISQLPAATMPSAVSTRQ